MDKIVSCILESPEKEFHVREIAKLVRVSPTTAAKEIRKLQQKKLISARKLSNHLLVKANTESPSWKELKKQYNLARLRSSGIIGFLERELNAPEAVILFGSYAKGEEGPYSDIDLFIVASSKKNPALEPFQKKLRRPIQLFIHSKEDIEKMKKTNKGLLNNVINGVIVYGYWEAFP
ncbi:nucleotidyltransferase domain-containing protein [Candidatus Woesearchaeota archaeon]|nr:nucleotidyltransferase domain-containing protein [Candidatus Woesearchaeota archaeon]